MLIGLKAGFHLRQLFKLHRQLTGSRFFTSKEPSQASHPNGQHGRSFSRTKQPHHRKTTDIWPSHMHNALLGLTSGLLKFSGDLVMVSPEQSLAHAQNYRNRYNTD